MPQMQAITPDAIRMLGKIAETGSMAAAARAMNLVPSALSYRVRQLERHLDVLLFDRSTRFARLTVAGQELLREGAHLLEQLEGLANRVHRIATGWEPQLTLAVDSIIVRSTLWQLCEQFFALGAPTRLRIREETLSGTLNAVLAGHADLAIGTVDNVVRANFQSRPLGEVPFIFAVAPQHALAKRKHAISNAELAQHRIVAVADSAVSAKEHEKISIGILSGQEVFTVPNLGAKLDAQLRGLGCGYLPRCLAQPYLDNGQLLQRATENTPRISRIGYVWPAVPKVALGKAMLWWLNALESPATRRALLEAQ
jgi:DNA-binding transcriptional LysR family regulator